MARGSRAGWLLALALVSACERAPAPPDASRTATPLDRATTGTIEGEAHFEGVPPAPRRVPVTSDPTCAAAHPDGLVVRDVRAADGRLADVFVAIATGLEGRVFAAPEAPVVVDQRGCLYVPRVAGAQVGQPIIFRSSDETLHNVHGEPRASSRWNFGLARAGAERIMTLSAPEIMVPVRCDVHPWMRLDLGVVDHPYFAITREDGGFRLSDVPAGTYTVVAWHPTLGRQQAEIAVRPREASQLTFRFTAPGGEPSA